MENLDAKIKNEVPFIGEMKKSDVDEDIMGFGKLNEMETIPGKVVRVEKFDTLKDRHEKNVDVLEMVSITKKLYDELEDMYGICVPAQFVVGKNEKGEKVVYSIVDKIAGKNLLEIEKTEAVARATAELYATLSKYFLDKLRSGDNFLFDIHGPQQYVYGKREGDQEEKIYLVDTDVYLSNDGLDMYTIVKWLAEYIKDMEKKFEIKFEKARECLREFVDEPLSQGLDFSEQEDAKRHLEVIKRFLNNEKQEALFETTISSFE